MDPIVLTVRPIYTDGKSGYVVGEGTMDKILQKLEATIHFKGFYDSATPERDDKPGTDAT